MAHKKILLINEHIVWGLMNARYYVHILFPKQEMYDNAVKLGFNKEVWETKNSNKVIIENGDNCYQCNSDLLEDEYGVCQKCINSDIAFMDRIKKEADEEYSKSCNKMDAK